MSRHQPSRLILHFIELPSLDVHLTGKLAVEAVDTAFELATDIRIIGVKWNEKENSIIITNPNIWLPTYSSTTFSDPSLQMARTTPPF
ncbi:hypothetical protein V8B97DRAFT_969233 [Scleroderma yunnanense]